MQASTKWSLVRQKIPQHISLIHEVKRNLNNAWFHFPAVRTHLCSQTQAWLMCAPDSLCRAAGMGKLGLALKFGATCRHPLRDWQSTPAGVGTTPQGTPWHKSVSSKYLNSEIVEWYIFFPIQEHRAEQTLWLGPRVAVPISRFPIHIFEELSSMQRDCFLLPVFRMDPLGLYHCPQHFLKLLPVVQPQFICKPQSVSLAW